MNLWHNLQNKADLGDWSVYRILRVWATLITWMPMDWDLNGTVLYYAAEWVCGIMLILVSWLDIWYDEHYSWGNLF